MSTPNIGSQVGSSSFSALPSVYTPSPIEQNQQNHKSSQIGALGSDPWSCAKEDRNSLIMCLIMSLGLAAIASVATYFCMVHGIKMLDLGYTSMSRFGAGFTIYCGVSYSCVALGNVLYLGGKLLLGSGTKFKYVPDEARKQFVVSLGAPIAAVPSLIYFGRSMASSGKQTSV